MEIMKGVRAADMIAIFASCLGSTPAAMQELFWRGLPLVPLPLPLLNIICTNVPGSPTALYTVGRRLVASYPQVPTGYELGLGVAVQSYDGKLFFGVTADAHVAPDAGRLRDYIRVCLQELSEAAGAKSAGPRSTPGPRKGPRTRSARPRPARRARPARSSAPVEPSPSPGTTAAEETVPASSPAAAQEPAPASRPAAAQESVPAPPPVAARQPVPAPPPAAVAAPLVEADAAGGEATQPQPALG